MLSILGKIFTRHENIFLIFPRIQNLTFHVVSNAVNLHEMSNLVFWEKYQFVTCLICPESGKC